METLGRKQKIIDMVLKIYFVLLALIFLYGVYDDIYHQGWRNGFNDCSEIHAKQR